MNLAIHGPLPESVAAMSPVRRWAVHPSVWLLIALSPVILWYVNRLDDGSDEPLGLLTLALVLGLAWRDRQALAPCHRARLGGAAMVLASVVSTLWLPPLLRAGLAVAGVAVFFGLHRRPGLLGLLVLSLPVVASLQFFAGYPMRLAVAEGMVRLLELGGVFVTRTGSSISISGQVVGVDPACSGVRLLWHSLVAAMALAACHRLSWKAATAAGLLAIILVIPANILRALVLVFEETGHWEKSGITHGGIGLACFVVVVTPLWILTGKRARPAAIAGPSAPVGRAATVMIVIAALLAPLLAVSSPRSPTRPAAGLEPREFTFDSLTLPLHALPSTPAELAFAKSFPGTLSSHRWGAAQVILRRVTTATRRLHPSRDCLRAAGFETGEAVTVTRRDGSEWACFPASRDGERFVVHERVTSERDGSSWTDVSAWYWSALGHPLNGPWRAETVIRAAYQADSGAP